MLIISIFFAIIIRLGIIQLKNNKMLTARAAEQWTRDLPINAKRGTITDCNGASLAESYSSYDVYVRASMVKDPVKVATLLANSIGLNYEETFKKVTNVLVSESLIKLQVESSVAKKLIDANLSGIIKKKLG